MSDRAPDPAEWEAALRAEDVAMVAALQHDNRGGGDGGGGGGSSGRGGAGNPQVASTNVHRNKMVHKRRSREARVKHNDLVGTTHSEKASRALKTAVSKGDYEAMMGAVDDGADVNFADDKGRTALHFAAAAGRDSFVQFLVSQGADANKQDSNGNSPLHLAACTNNIKVITALVDSGCDLHLRDGKGRTAIHFAQSHLQILRRYSSNPEAYRGKVLEVVNLLLAYSKRHNRTALEGLNDLASRLPTQSVDEIEDVLGELVNMSLASLK